MNHDHFDSIIVGGGIAGLVCGNYLAKAGLKVLIIEKNKNVGGYCRSFYPANNLRFDSCVHSLSSCRSDGVVGKVISELELDEFLTLSSYEIPDIVFYGKNNVRFYKDINLTIEEFSRAFPKEVPALKFFFRFVHTSKDLTLPSFKNLSYDQFLKETFSSPILRKILSVPILISSSVFTNKLSAFIGCAILREHILDGGYYPAGGVQSFPNALLQRYQSFGGKIFCNTVVKQILVEQNHVKGVILQDQSFVSAKNIVSCCDMIQTYTKLIAERNVVTYWRRILEKMQPSMSSVCLYLGARGIVARKEFRSTLYFTNDKNSILNVYKSFRENDNNSFLLSCPTVQEKPDESHKSLSFLLLTNAFYNNKEFWIKNKNQFKDNLIAKLKRVLPEVVDKAFFVGIATPLTLENWTFNFMGAASGWASIPTQIANPGIKIKSNISGLYLAGHWLTRAHGVVSAAYTARRAAFLLLKGFSDG